MQSAPPGEDWYRANLWGRRIRVQATQTRFQVGIRVLVAAALLATVTVVSSAEAGRDRQRASGNYLIVVPPDYDGSAPMVQFANAKAAMGFNVITYSVPSGTSRTAIKSYIEGLWGTPQSPKYVLLVGDTDGSSSGDNTIPHFIGQGSKHADTDLPYGCMDGPDDWYPDICVGRFSVRTVSQLQAVVDKTLFVEAGSYPDPAYVKRGAFLANPSTYGQAEPTHDWVIENYFEPAGYEGIKLYASQGADTADVTAAINNGALFTLYFGHSSSSGWWDPSFDQSDINGLSNEGLYGLAFGWSCNTAHFSYDECAGETWLRAANKGAAAYISASNYIYWGSVAAWEPSVLHEKAFFASFFEDNIWEVGPAWRAGLFRFNRVYGLWDGNPAHGPLQHEDEIRNFFEEFVLLGDPGLLLPQPYGFSMSPAPAMLDLCCPPETQAQYTIEVDEMGGFDEVVNLTISGEPAGATVDLSVNDQAPPFTTVLTLGNLTAVAGGSYNVVVTGTTSSMQRTTNVGLSVATGPPAQPTLSEPPSGATDVSLMPTLVWEALPDALEYELEVATDASFTDVVYSTTLTATNHTLDTPLAMVREHFWHVRGLNTCGDGDYCPAFSFTTVNVLLPVTYDLLNGETGSYTYFDDAYNGLGDNSVPLAPLSDGLGDLTNGVIATQHWNQNNWPYIGWHTIEPTITFHFAEPINLAAVTIHVDDSGGGGGVVPPSDVVLTMGGTTLQYAVTDPPGSAPFAATFNNLGMTGDMLELTLEDDGFTSSRYMMLSEVEFEGAPVAGACCVGGSCEVMTESDCVSAGGEYQGDDTTCDPNPCAVHDSSCLIISEVVDGAESGGCPKFVEITNTGLEDYTFPEGGLIIQDDASSDVTLDIDLTGAVIGAGRSYVVNSNQEGDCGGAFSFVYGFDADLNVAGPIGDGNDRYILTDTANGSNLLDIYGEFGVDGSKGPWDYTMGYSYRQPDCSSGNDGSFAMGEWYIGGMGSLSPAHGDPTQLLLAYTTPGEHDVDGVCLGNWVPGDLDGDGDVDLYDFGTFAGCMAGPDVGAPPAGCEVVDFIRSDLEGDGDVDLADFGLFGEAYTGS